MYTIFNIQLILNYTIEHQDLSIKAYQQIKQMILRGDIKPGEKLAQENIAKQLNISRMPLHKAFQMLENELLVESQPRRGFFVKGIDWKTIADAFECREAIEGIAARRTAKIITEEEIDYLYRLFAPFKEDISNCDIVKYQEADYLFHTKIIKLSNNQILARMEFLGNILLSTYQQGLIRLPEKTLPEHFAIIDALKNHDSDMSEFLIRKHFELSRKDILDQLKNY